MKKYFSKILGLLCFLGIVLFSKLWECTSIIKENGEIIRHCEGNAYRDSNVGIAFKIVVILVFILLLIYIFGKIKKYLWIVIGLLSIFLIIFFYKPLLDCGPIVENGRIIEQCTLSTYGNSIVGVVFRILIFMVPLFIVFLPIYITIKILKFIYNKQGGGREFLMKELGTEKTITVCYVPPNDIEVADIFRFRYEAKNSRVFSSLFYYRISKGWIEIEYKIVEKINKENNIQEYIKIKEYIKTYYLKETEEIKTEGSSLDKEIFEVFFGSLNGGVDEIELDERLFYAFHPGLGPLEYMSSSIGKKIDTMFDVLKERSQSIGLRETRKFWERHRRLSPKGQELFEQLCGYKEYLEKVELPTLKKEIENNFEYINKDLPWISLFEIERQIFPTIQLYKPEDIVKALPGFFWINKTGKEKE